MRPVSFATLFLLALSACVPAQKLPTESTALPPLTVTLTTSVVQPGRVLLVWSVRNGEDRWFEILRKNRDEPFKHYATLVPVAGEIQVDDTGVLPGQSYLYRLRLFGAPGEAFLDQYLATVPL